VSPQAAATTKKILLADDQADVRLLLATRLRMLPGLAIVGEAASGAEVLVQVREHNPDLVILDLDMPVMNGMEVIPILRAVAPETRILVYSGLIGERSLVGPYKPDARIAKGTDLGLLVETMQQLLEETPDDIVDVDLRVVPAAVARAAFDAWVGLSARIRDEGAGGAVAPPLSEADRADLLSLVAVFIRIGDPMLRAAEGGDDAFPVRFRIRRDAAQAARRALISITQGGANAFHQRWGFEITPESRDAVNTIYARLLEALPVG
jgi:CheY-like chemotaxis protein